MGWRSQCTKCPILFSVEVSAASLPSITATNKIPLGVVRRGLEQLGKPPSPMLSCMAWNCRRMLKVFSALCQNSSCQWWNKRKPSFLWWSLWYLQWWKLSLRLLLWLGYSKPSFVAWLLHEKSWAYAFLFPGVKAGIDSLSINKGWNEPTSPEFIRMRQRGAYVHIKILT